MSTYVVEQVQRCKESTYCLCACCLHGSSQFRFTLQYTKTCSFPQANLHLIKTWPLVNLNLHCTFLNTLIQSSWSTSKP